MNNDLQSQAYTAFHAALRSWYQDLITFEQFLEITRNLTEELKAAIQKHTMHIRQV